MDIGEPRVTRVTASTYTHARVRACTHVSARKAANVCVKIDYTAGENVINSSTNKGLRRLYNANSKNRGGLRELRRGGRDAERRNEDREVGEGGVPGGRAMVDDRVARRWSRNNTDACDYSKFA